MDKSNIFGERAAQAGGNLMNTSNLALRVCLALNCPALASPSMVKADNPKDDSKADVPAIK